MSVSAKYRSLSSAELQEMEKEFVDYLIVNGITADDWQNLKKEELQKAEDIITLFSDVVFEGIFRKVQFLEKRTATEIRTCQCLQEKMIVIGLKSVFDNIDLRDSSTLHEVLKNPPKGMELYQGEKEYANVRETTLFDMTESGYSISDGELFKGLALALAD